MSKSPLIAEKNITNDPVYYVTVGFFALLTSGLPAALGQPRFLPVIQTLALVTFVAVALHQRNVRGAITTMTLWLPIQFVVITLLTWQFLGQVENAFADGFAYQAAITTWFFGGAPHPTTFLTNPFGFLTEFAMILVGSLVTAGLLGMWFLVRLVNLAAYGTGILLTTLSNPLLTLLVIPYWTLLRAAGYAGLIVFGAMPLLTYQWSPQTYWPRHRPLILISLALIVAGIILELFLPGLVARTPAN